MNSKVKTIIIILLILFLYPLGLILAIFWSGWPKWAKWLSASPLLLALLGIVVTLILVLINPNRAIQQAKQQQEETQSLYSGSLKARDNQTKSDISSVRSVLELYKVDHQKYPARLSDLVPKYLPQIQNNRASGLPYQYIVSGTGDNGAYVLSTKLSDGTTYSQTSP